MLAILSCKPLGHPKAKLFLRFIFLYIFNLTETLSFFSFLFFFSKGHYSLDPTAICGFHGNVDEAEKQVIRCTPSRAHHHHLHLSGVNFRGGCSKGKVLNSHCSIKLCF